MINRRLLWLISVILFVTVAVFGADKPIVDCNVSRITVPLSEYNSKVTSAASFMYGVYAENPNDQDDFLDSDDLMEKFNELTEEERWQYPEYVVIKNFQAWKAGDKEEAMSYYEPGYNRERARALQTQPIEKIQSIMEPFTRVVFIDKAYLRPYVRIYWVMSEVSESGNTKGGRGFPGYSYLKLVGNRYMLTHEIDMTHLFDAVVGTYDSRTLMFLGNESIPLNPDTSGMDWFAMDVDTASPAENKKWLKVFSTDGISDVPPSFSENYLKVYVRAEPLNIEFEAGKQREGSLSEEMRFFESAVTAHKQDDENNILSKWSGKTRERLEKKIKELKDSGQWPESKYTLSLPFGPAPTVVSLVRTSAGTAIYYKKKSFGPSDEVKGNTINQAQSKIFNVGLQEEKGNYTLFKISSQGEFNVLTNQMFIDAVKVLYEH